MQYGHYNLQRTLVLLLVHINGDSTTIVLYGDRVVFVDGHLDVGTETSQGFVDGIVDCFVNQMMETLFRDVSNVHGRALTHGFQSFQDLNVRGRILGLLLLFYVIIFFHNSNLIFNLAKVQKKSELRK